MLGVSSPPTRPSTSLAAAGCLSPAATDDLRQNEEWQLKGGDMQKQLFEAALGVSKPWLVRDIDFDTASKVLTIDIDFASGRTSRYLLSRAFIRSMTRRSSGWASQLLPARVLPGSENASGEAARRRVVLVEPEWFGKLSGFTLLFEALVLAMAQQMSFAAVAKLTGCRGIACTRSAGGMSISPWPKPTCRR